MEMSFIDIFEEQVLKTPDHIAVVFEKNRCSYQELNERSNRLAWYLRSKGVKEETMVPLYIERGINMLVGMLGIMKAGGAYVPVDTDFPSARIQYMLNDTGASIIVTSKESASKLPVTEGADQVEIEAVANQPSGNLSTKVLPGHLAYVIYTSGSTGTPKGVMIEHRNLVDYITGLIDKTRINECQSFALVSTLATDLGNTVIYGSLASGGALHLFTKESVSNIEYLHNYFAEHNIECLKIVPSHWKVLNQEDKLLLPAKLLIFGGEVLSEKIVEDIQFSGAKCVIVNHYGPTETTIGKLLYMVGDGSKYEYTIPIGKPFSNTKVLVLTKNLKLCPIGVPGQLYITGDGLARGYLNNAELTKEKFIQNPFSKKGYAVMYSTGDLVKYLPDGNISFIGRVDNQVKIRGYRIELGEIEHMLQQCDMVSQAVVLAREDKQGNKRLVSYVVVEETFDREEIMSYLKGKLPDYMIPAVLMEMKSFPLTSNGKIDRNALPDPDDNGLLSNEYVGPRNETEVKLAGLWQDVLEVEQAGINDDFFELGGHSLLAVRLVSAIRKAFVVEMPIGDIFDYPTIALLAAQLVNQSGTPVLPVIEKVKMLPERIPLSFSQERIWFMHQLGGSLEYHVPSVLRLTGSLNKDALAAALKNIVQRHEILRTVYLEQDGEPYQCIKNADGCQLLFVDGKSFIDDEQGLKRYIQEQINIPFNLAADYMLRAVLISLQEEENILLVTLHHIASDGWSRSILVNDFVELYNAFEEKRPAILPALRLQYADYAIWQRAYLEGAVLNSKMDYWNKQLQGVSALQLPTDFPRPVIQSTKGANAGFHIDKELSVSLLSLSQQQGTTLFMTLLAAFKVLLYRYTSQQDICVGTPIAGRQQQEVEGLIGFFINTLALRTQVNGDESFIALLQQVRAVTLKAYENQELPFEKVVEMVVRERDLGRSPLFQVMFVLQNTPDSQEVTLPELTLSGEVLEINTSKFDISFYVTETANGLHCSVEYCTALFSGETITRMIAHYKALLTGVVKSPKQVIGLLPMFGLATQQYLLNALTGKKADYPLNQSLLNLFEEQVSNTPGSTALIFEKNEITYKQIDDRSNQLAHYLNKKEVKAGTLVPICMERSFDMVIVILAILKTGGTYVPIDQDYPQDRVSFILEDIGAKILITDINFTASFINNESFETIQNNDLAVNPGQAAMWKGVEIICVGDVVTFSDQPSTKLPVHFPSDNVACIIYTSGSSGRPKGVKLSHAGIINRLHWMWDAYPFNAGEINAIKTSIGFVDHIWELFGALNRGIVSVIFPKPALLDLDVLVKKLNAEKVTRLVLVPSLLRTLLNKLQEEGISLPCLKYWTSSGETLSAELVSAFYKVFPASTHKLLNIYGSTEVTADVSCYETSADHQDQKGRKLHQPVPIGKPISNTSIYLLDKWGQLVAQGIAGEICVAGVQVAQGYLNLPELTAERFTVDAFSETPGAQIFRTGDFGRLLEDGNIEYLGRIDDQVKIRGNRVELSEIEAVLHQAGLVKQSLIVTKTDNSENNILVGYVIGDETIDKQELSNSLRNKLPGYMVPAVWVQLPAFPVTASGKIDRKALPDPYISELAVKEYTAPGTEMEKQLQATWQQLLRKERIGIHDNFFELGGHSLLAMRVVSSIRKVVKVEFSIKDLFLHSTIAALANHLQYQSKVLLLPAIEIQPRPEHIPLSFSQERLWFIDHLEGSIQYHLPVVVRLKGKLNVNALSSSIKSIVSRHEVLRTVINEQAGHAYQKIKDVNSWEVTTIDAATFKREALTMLIKKVIDAPFDLSKDYMLRANLIIINELEHLLVATIHHIASDGWSMSVIVKELIELYSANEEGRQANLTSLPVQYADYSLWQRKNLQGNVLDHKLAYWENKLQGVSPLLLQADHTRPAIKSNAGARAAFHINKDLSDKIKLLGQQQNATLFMTLLTAFKVLLHRYTGQEDICVGSPIANRTTYEVEELIGFFVNTLALRTAVNEKTSFIALLQQVRATVMEAYEHQDTPFEKVVDAVVKERDLGRSPIFQVMFVLQNIPAIPQLHLGDLQLSFEKFDNNVSKFDITLTITETPHGLQAAFDYCTDLFKEQTIFNIIVHFQNLLNSIVNSPEQLIDGLAMLSEEEENKLLVEFNGSSVKYPADKTIISLFEEQANKNPADPAVIFEQKKITYAALNERSNQLANYLRSKGVKNETLVPICVNRTEGMIVAILAILKAGGAYVPIDPDYPEERIAYMLEDTGAAIMLSNKESRTKLNVPENIEIIEIDGDWSAINKYSSDNLQTEIAPHNLAYVIYTSGSTGRPKGVMIEHNALLDHCFGVIKSAGLTKCRSFALFAPLVFDAGHSLIHSSFILGSALHVLSNQLLNDGEKLSAYINDHAIDCVKIVPSLWLSYADINSFILAKKVMIFGGDSFSVNILDRLAKLNYHGEVYNHYGPTEATIGKTIHQLDLKKQYIIVPIGKPFSNTGIYIVNKLLQLVPVGVPGELYIAGEGLARGYLNNPALTAEKFIADPFSKNTSAKMYKTGDQARWLPDGNIEYLGRMDDQIKIRGFRIEPGEIESVLQKSGLVQQAVVLPKYAGSGNKVLVGYIVPEGNFDKETIVAWLKNKLPEYMIPSLWVPLQQIPLTSNGKIDRKGLPDPDINSILDNRYLAPRTTPEQILANIWQELLGVQKIGINDNFFGLGGDSIITIQVVSRARQFGYEFQVADIFTHQSIAKLAAVIEQRMDGSLNITGEQQLLSGASGLLPIQQRYFAKEHVAINHFNQTVLLQIEKNVDEASLTLAIQQLSRHHDILRCRFFQKDGHWHQEYGDKQAVLIIDDISEVDDSRAGSLITELSAGYQQKLDIEKGELIKVVLIKTPNSSTHNRLLIVIHHLVVDGVSWRILLEDLELLLNGFISGNDINLGHKTSSYRQWYNALEKYSQSNRLLSQVGYWQKIVSGYHPLPADKVYDGLVKAKERGFYNARLDADQTRSLIQDTPRLYHSDINDILLTALYITIRKWSGANTIIIGLEGHGRQDIYTAIDTSRTVGWFSSHYPLLLEVVEENPTMGDFVKSVKEQLRQVPDKGLGYGVSRYINNEKSLQGMEPWEIVFNYLGQLDNVLSQGKWLKPAGESSGTAVNENYLISEKIAVNSSIQSGELQINWSFSKLHYDNETITELSKEYLLNLGKIIAHCTSTQTAEINFTPSDYGLGSVISYKELDRFLDEPVKDKTRRESISGLYRLSGLQQGLLFHSLYETGFGTYVHQFGCDLIGTDLDIFTQSWNRVIRNHSILRSAFYHDVFSVPVQCVYKEVELPVEFMDLRNMDHPALDKAIADYENVDRYKSFDYKKAPLMRLALLQVGEDRYRMIWTWHHILFDGWSMPVLMEEFLTTYEALVTGNEIITVEEDRYEEYIRYIETGDKEKEKNYWLNYLKDVGQSTLLPFIGSTSERTKGAGAYKTLSMQLDSGVTSRVQRYAQNNRITLNTVMQGVWSCLLHQYTGNDNIVYGVIVSGRPDDLPGVEKRVGLYINAVPFHTNIQDEKNITSWLQNLQTEQVESRQFQYTGLSDIQGWTGIQGDLFDNLLVFDNYPVSKIISSRPWSLQVENPHLHEQNNYPLSIVIISNPEQITIQFLYNTALIQEAYADSLRNHFEHVLLQVVSNKNANIGDITFLTKAEENLLLVKFNDTSVSYPKNSTVIDLFEEQVIKSPHAIAIVFKEGELTYQQLNDHANRLAHYLRGMGIKEDILVPVCIEKSFEMFIGILAILKAGGAYIPIDPQYPVDRIKYMVEDAGATIVLSSRQSSALLKGISGIEIIELDESPPSVNLQPTVNLHASIAASHLAYVIYTSGSTGKPKGVMIEHGNLVHYLLNNKTRYLNNALQGSGSFIHLSYTFDASLTAMFMPLLSGKLVVIGSKQSAEVFEDVNLWKYAPYDFIKITPSHLEFLQTSIKNETGELLTKKLVIGGEALNAGHFNYLVEKDINLEIINEYGPTEATVGCNVYSFHTLDNYEEIKNGIPIGKPVDNVQLYILNEGSGLVPVGVVGQICIGGDGLARGYLNLPELTEKKFIHNPYSKNSGAVMYKTGDLGRWLPDGNMEYCGRIDDQVKINGYRIELGEIESTLSSIEGISNTKVIVKESKTAGSFKLNAYLQIDREKLPLLNNYLGLLNKKKVQQSDLHLLPNGLPVLSSNLNEVRFLYNEIFEDHCYLKHGISLKEDSCVIDIGANVGFFTVYLNILSKNIQVYSVEPIPEVYNYLVANRELYGIRGKAFQLAVSDKEGEVDFTWYPQVSIVSGMSDEISQVKEVVRSYIENSKKENFENEEIDSMLEVKLETRQIRCKTKTLSQIIEEEEIEKIDLLKVDVENSEHLVMNGILDKDWDKIGSVIIEVHDVNDRLNRIRETLERKGFKTFVEKEKMLSKDDILYNLFALKNEHADGLTSLSNNEELRKRQWKDGGVFVKSIETEIKEKLPAYMVPSNVVLMDQFPLTGNGKVDKNAFPDVDENGLTDNQYIAPRNELEEKLADIWKQILEVDKVGIHDDFFDLGGDSLLSIRLISSIRRELEVELAISTFFELVTIEKVARYIKISQPNLFVQYENYEEIKL